MNSLERDTERRSGTCLSIQFFPKVFARKLLHEQEASKNVLFSALPSQLGEDQLD